MKRLILIRHAKSSWEYNVNDIERPLSKRGIEDANLMTKIYKELSINVQHIYSSNSKRTLQTSEIFIRNLKLDKIPFDKSNELYDFSGLKVESFIKKLDSNLNSVMIFSHNNSCSNLMEKFTGDYKHVPTCGILIFDFDVYLWSEIYKGKCNYYFPKQFK